MSFQKSIRTPYKPSQTRFCAKTASKPSPRTTANGSRTPSNGGFVAWPVSRASALPPTTEKVAGPVPTEALLICYLRASSTPRVSEFTRQHKRTY